MIPIPFIAYFGYCIGTNIFVAHSIFKSIMWTIPFFLVIGFRRNVTNNAKTLIHTIHLLETGTQVEIKNVNGDSFVYPIKYLRRITQQELGKFKLAAGPLAEKILDDYFPIFIDNNP